MSSIVVDSLAPVRGVRRWQAIVVTSADRLGKPIERRVLSASGSEELYDLLDAHYGFIEEAGLFEFRRRRFLGLSLGVAHEIVADLPIAEDARYDAAQEAWRQRIESGKS